MRLPEGVRQGVLLLPGLSGSPQEMRFLASQLAQRGFCVAAPELERLKGSDWRDWIAACEAELAALSADCDEVHVGGHCIGAVLALELAARRPESLASLVLYSPTLEIDGWAVPLMRRMACWLGAIGRLPLTGFSEGPPMGIKDDRIRRFLMRTPTNDAGELRRHSINASRLSAFHGLKRQLQPRLRRIETPTLVVHARDDDLSSLKNAFAIQRQVSGPVDTLVLDDSYHIVMLDRQRQQVADRTVEHLMRHSAAEWADARSTHGDRQASA